MLGTRGIVGSVLAVFAAGAGAFAQDFSLDWLRSDGGPGFDRPTRIVVFPDGSSALFGDGTDAHVFGSTTLPPDLDEYGNWVVRLEPDGTPRWAAALHLDHFRHVHVGFAAEPDGSVLLATSYTTRLTVFDATNTPRIVRNGFGPGNTGIVLRYGPDGTVDLVHELLGTATTRGPDVVIRDLHRAADGSLTLTGSFLGRLELDDVALESSGVDGDMMLLRIGADGTAAWGQCVAARAAFGNRIVGLPDGSVVVQGFHNGDASFGGSTVLSGGLYRRFVARYDVDGALLWARPAILNPDDESSIFCGDLASRSDGTTYLAGWLLPSEPAIFGEAPHAQSITPSVATAYLACFDGQGQLAWLRTTDTGLAVGSGVTVLPDDDIVFGGFFRGWLSFPGTGYPVIQGTGANTGNLFLARFDPTGATIEDVVVNDSGFAEMHHVAGHGNALVASAIADGTMQVEGASVTTQGADMLTLKLSAGQDPLFPNLVVRPDLVRVEAVSFDRLDVRATVLNAGLAPSPAGTVVDVRLDELDGTSRTVPYHMGSIAPGGSELVQLSLVQGVEDVACIVVIADPDDAVAEDDPRSALDEEADNEVVVPAAVLWETRYETGFEDGETWELAEEIFKPQFYADGLGQLSYPDSAARTGLHGLRIHANAVGSQDPGHPDATKSNILIAFERISPGQHVEGVWRFSFHVRLPSSGEGQAAPTFTMQNTRFLPGSTEETETFAAGFQYIVNDEDTKNYRTWNVFVNGRWRRVRWGPVLQPGAWYLVTFVVDFTNNRYRQLRIEVPGNQSFEPLTRALHHRVPALAKGFGNEGFTISVEAENKFTSATRVTDYAIDCDDVKLEQAQTR